MSENDATSTPHIIRRPNPEIRVKAIDFIDNLYCIICSYKSECSSRYPKHLIKCRYLEEWALTKYREAIRKSSKR